MGATSMKTCLFIGHDRHYLSTKVVPLSYSNEDHPYTVVRWACPECGKLGESNPRGFWRIKSCFKIERLSFEPNVLEWAAGLGRYHLMQRYAEQHPHTEIQRFCQRDKGN